MGNQNVVNRAENEINSKLKEHHKGKSKKETEERSSLNKAETDQSTPTHESHSKKTNRGTKSKRKKEKIVVVAKNQNEESHEKEVLELIQKNNPEGIDYDIINTIIEKHFFMQTLNKQARTEIIKTVSLYRVKEGDNIITQGSCGDYWYIIHKGVAGGYINNDFKKNIVEGESFGEFALLYNAPRSATIKAESECQLWVLKREAFHKIVDGIFQMNYDENISFLSSIDLPLDSAFKSLLANNLIRHVYKEGDVIFKEGEGGQCMYIIKEGEVNCIKDNNLIRVLQKGDNFGQKAILLENTRSLDVVAKTNCILYSISVEFFKIHLGPNYKDSLYASFIQMALSNSNNCKVIPQKSLEKIYPFFEVKNYSKGEEIFKKHEIINNKVCIVGEGNIYNQSINKIEANRNEILFEKLIFEEKEIKLKYSLTADPDCLVAMIDYDKIKNEITSSSSSNVSELDMSAINQISLFRNLSEDVIDRIKKNIATETFSNGKKIINQGEEGNKFYIIKSGRVDFFIKSKYIRSLNDNEEFGARSLIISEKRSATAIANGPVTCYTGTAEVFKSILEPNGLEYFQNKAYLEDNTIELRDLDEISELGKGNFGSVHGVRSRKNKQLYAIKALNVNQIQKEKLETCVELEKNVLGKVDHPFIMKMVKYMKNEHFIFFLMEYIKGKELWEVIRDIGLLNKEQTCFYGASMFIAIDYLHQKKIIYRDIKPENIMINDKGYVKIIDFGTVKEINERTSTIIGTPHYMAPEIVRGEGYSFQVDIWSIAICLYEFFCGKLPFGEDQEDIMDVYKAVVKEDGTFPQFVKDKEFISLLNKMGKKNPLNRLCKGEQIKEHKYFSNFNWNQGISLSMPPAYTINFKENNGGGSNVPYLNVIKSEIPKCSLKKKQSKAQLEFHKWLMNF